MMYSATALQSSSCRQIVPRYPCCRAILVQRPFSSATKSTIPLFSEALNRKCAWSGMMQYAYSGTSCSSDSVFTKATKSEANRSPQKMRSLPFVAMVTKQGRPTIRYICGSRRILLRNLGCISGCSQCYQEPRAGTSPLYASSRHRSTDIRVAVVATFTIASWGTGRARGPPLRPLFAIWDPQSGILRCSGGAYPRLPGRPGGHPARPYDIPSHASAAMPLVVVAGFIPASWGCRAGTGPAPTELNGGDEPRPYGLNPPPHIPTHKKGGQLHAAPLSFHWQPSSYFTLPLMCLAVLV